MSGPGVGTLLVLLVILPKHSADRANGAPAPAVSELAQNSARNTEHARSRDPLDRACSVFCEGPILHAVQNARLFNDSKTFVDMPLRTSPEQALRDFQQEFGATAVPPAVAGAVPDKDLRARLADFVRAHFNPPGSDLEPWTPDDWQAFPPALAAVENFALRQFALAVNEFWKLLGRKTKVGCGNASSECRSGPERHSLLALPHPTIVPGGRFRETYYWDSFWILRGLLACDMFDTARGLVLNLIHQAQLLGGYVPNGGRAYYRDRSQPPVLALMVHDYVVATNDVDTGRGALEVLKREHAWWMAHRSVELGEGTRLNHYDLCRRFWNKHQVHELCGFFLIV